MYCIPSKKMLESRLDDALGIQTTHKSLGTFSALKKWFSAILSILHILGLFLECKKRIFYDTVMVPRISPFLSSH